MSDFVAGAISGLLGAITGGIFTAWGARVQVKAAISAAHLQVSSAQEAQRKAAFNNRRLVAADDIVRSLVTMLRELQEMDDEHHEAHHSSAGEACAEPIPSAVSIKKINCWRRELDRITYEHSDFLEAMGAGDLEYPGPFGYVLSGNDWAAIASRFPAELPGECVRVQWSDDFFSSLHGLIQDACAERYRYI